MNAFNFTIPFPVDRVVVKRRTVEEVVGEGDAASVADQAPQQKEVLETLYDGSYDSGVAEGRRQAVAEMTAARDAESAQVAAMLRRMQQILDELVKLAEGHFPDLLMSALERVFREHPFTSDEMATEVSALLREVGQAQSIVVEGSATEISQIESRIEKMGLSIQHGRLQWRANPNLQRGEYILQTDLGMVDGRRHSKLAQVRLALET